MRLYVFESASLLLLFHLYFISGMVARCIVVAGSARASKGALVTLGWCHGGFSDRYLFKPGGRNEHLAEDCPGDDHGRQADGVDVLIRRERDCAQGPASDVNDGDLHNEGDRGDAEEPVVLENSSEDIVFLISELAGVDLVEELHKNEELEGNCVHVELGGGSSHFDHTSPVGVKS